MAHTPTRRVRILVNRRSGVIWSFEAVQRAFDHHWDTAENDVSYQFCHDKEDGRLKAQRAVEQGFDLLLVVGGDGTVNTAGSALMGTNTVLGVVPMGSGNGFARHFGISLDPEKAAQSLATGKIRPIDVGLVNGQPFLITCSMAWDAAIVRSFDKSPVRGVLPYVFAGIYEFFEYKPQAITAELDSGEVVTFPDPVVFTVANLTQFGGGALIAPHARADDGCLELIAARRQDVAVLFSNLLRLFNGTIERIPRVLFRSFKTLTVQRAFPSAIQVDGELIQAPATIEVRIEPQALRVLVPKSAPT